MDGSIQFHFSSLNCWSRCETKGNAKLSPFPTLSLFLVTTPSALLPPLTQLQPLPPLGALCPRALLFLKQLWVRGSPPLHSSHAGDAEHSALSCRRQPCQANHLGRRAPGASTGVLAWPRPCRAEQPRHAEVGMVWEMGWAVPVPQLTALRAVGLQGHAATRADSPRAMWLSGSWQHGALVGHCLRCE